jgi:hypothetical protein
MSEASSPSQVFVAVAKHFCMFGIWSKTKSNSWICSPHNPIPFLPFYTLYKYIDLYLFTPGRGGGGEPVRRL